MRRLLILALICVLCTVSAGAFAANEGYAAGTTTLYSGPDASYPPVDTIPAGARLFVEGCTDGYEWCDVISGEDRGWMAADYIQYDYGSQTVFLPNYAAAIGIPIVTFAIGDYWSRYYRSRPFYAQRDRWAGRAFVHRPPPVFHGVAHDYVRGPVRELPAHPFAHAPVPHAPPVRHETPAFHGGPAHEAPHHEAPHQDEHRH